MALVTMLLIGFLSFTGAQGAICYPGENLWQMTKDICSIIEPCCSTLDSTASVIEGCCSVVDRTSSIVDGCCSVVDGTFSVVNTISSELDSCCSVIDRTSSIVDGCCSVVDGTSSVVSIIASELDSCCSVIDRTSSIVDGCCSAVDGTSSVVSVIASELDSCCSVIDRTSSVLDSCCSVIERTDSIVDGCCSTVDVLENCLIGTPITQAIMPYTVPGPGNYYLCESVTGAFGEPAITIGADDVYLNLNGHTITNTDDRGILCSDHNNVQICNGVITSFLEAIVVDGGSNYVNIHDINTFNTAVTGILIDTSSYVTVKDCVCQGDNGQLVTPLNGMVSVLDSSNVDIVGVTVKQVIARGFVVDSTQETVCLMDCIADDCGSYGFLLTVPAGPALNAALVKNCTAVLCSDGFTFENTSNVAICNSIASNCTTFGYSFTGCVGGLIENCVATGNTTGFVSTNSDDLTCSHCVSTSNSTDGFFIQTSSLNNILDGCIAARNANAGINDVNPNATTFIVDTRSSSIVVTSDNPVYQLNGAPDVFGGATIIVTS